MRDDAHDPIATGHRNVRDVVARHQGKQVEGAVVYPDRVRIGRHHILERCVDGCARADHASRHVRFGDDADERVALDHRQAGQSPLAHQRRGLADRPSGRCDDRIGVHQALDRRPEQRAGRVERAPRGVTGGFRLVGNTIARDGFCRIPRAERVAPGLERGFLVAGGRPPGGRVDRDRRGAQRGRDARPLAEHVDAARLEGDRRLGIAVGAQHEQPLENDVHGAVGSAAREGADRGRRLPCFPHRDRAAPAEPLDERRVVAEPAQLVVQEADDAFAIHARHLVRTVHPARPAARPTHRATDALVRRHPRRAACRHHRLERRCGQARSGHGESLRAEGRSGGESVHAARWRQRATRRLSYPPR